MARRTRGPRGFECVEAAGSPEQALAPTTLLASLPDDGIRQARGAGSDRLFAVAAAPSEASP